jgi:hypothetical protein
MGLALLEKACVVVNLDNLIAVTTTGSSNRFRSSLGELPEQIAAIRESSIMVIRYP